MQIEDALAHLREPEPIWFSENPLTPERILHHFFRSRMVYYPGCGGDNHPLRTFGMGEIAHCFFLTDYIGSIDTYLNAMHGEEWSNPPLPPSRVLFRTEIDFSTTPGPRMPHDLHLHDRNGDHGSVGAVFEIREYLRDREGRQRVKLAILFGNFDGIRAWGLFHEEPDLPPPFAVLLQDHGFGCNWDHFGDGGRMHQIAQSRGRLPDWLLVGTGTEPWRGYTRVKAEGSVGGMHRNLRRLYKQGRGATGKP